MDFLLYLCGMKQMRNDMKTRHYTYKDIEREERRTNRLFAVVFGTLTAISCGMVFYMVIDGIINTFK